MVIQTEKYIAETIQIESFWTFIDSCIWKQEILPIKTLSHANVVNIFVKWKPFMTFKML